MEHKNREELYATRADSEHDAFAVQINTFDRYQSTPTAFDRSAPPAAPPDEGYTYHHVPVTRAFGSLPTGHNIIVHIHGAFPYLYIPWEKIDCFALQMKLERAVAISLTRNKKPGESEAKNDEESDSGKVLKYIAHVSLCKGVPFYGYHVGHRLFFKISLLNPSYLNRLADLLREGQAMGRKVDVFEAHIPYGLQFLTDYNLFGCGWLRLQNLFIRMPILYDDDLKTDDLVEYMMGYNTTTIPRIGRSALEIDTSVQFILNRSDLKERNLHHDFVEKLGKVEMDDFIYIQSTKDLWKDGAYQRKMKGKEPYSSPLTMPRTPSGKWVEADENATLFNYVKGLKPGSNELNFNTFVRHNPSLDNIPTAFESVSELFHAPQLEDEEEEDHHTTTHGEIFEDEDDIMDELFDGHDDFPPDDEDALPDVFEHEDEDDQAVIESDPHFPSISDGSKDDTPSNLISDEHLIRQMTLGKRTYSAAFHELSTQPVLGKLTANRHRYIYKKAPPTDLCFEEEGLLKVQYQAPFYMETPPKPFIHAGKKFKLESQLLQHMPTVTVSEETLPTLAVNSTRTKDKDIKNWKYTVAPPSFNDVAHHDYRKQRPLSQINVKRSFKFATQKTAERRPDGSNNMTVIIAEVFVPTRGDLKPDPNHDKIATIFWRTMNGDETQEGMLCIESELTHQRVSGIEALYFDRELDMIEHFAAIICGFDPDIIAGYEVHSSSWGYIIDRCRAIHEYDFLGDISRVTSKGLNKMGDHWGYTHTSSIQVCGRHTINIWRPLRDLNMSKTSLEFVAYHLLHMKVPHFTHKTLTEMARMNFNGVVKHMRRHTEVDAKLIQTAEIISRAAEQARLIGVDFNDVFYRGSQYKVESLMTRIAKAENLMMLSPSKKQVRNQKPLECIPMVMEPISQLYDSPLLVLDFQSLYPSIIIAFNYCYSTLLGRMKNYNPDGSNPIGAGRSKHPEGLLKLLSDDVNLSPNGLMFVNSTVRKSLIAKMLEDLLDTRFMVKSTMKFLDPNMQQLYNNRQLALKLTANVTYGYTSASFSGRMPCSDIADAIVQSGRETLEKAIEMIESEPSWGAKVVYGDTDSLFVYLPGRSREDAFRLGREMADAVTKSNPDPITLKFEKVYHPALLMAKKRYVGYSYEHEDSPAKFDAKGIETVRRDGHPAQQHIVEQCLRTLFETRDITEIKSYVLEEFNKIINNDVSIQDFCFARAVKVGTYKNPPPGAIVSEKKMAEDARAEPQYRERVPYVIVQDPNSILRERARSPEDFIKGNYKLDAEYYIIKTLIPPLERIFTLVGVDVRQWYTDMPRKTVKGSIYSVKCLSCGCQSKSKLCDECRRAELQTVLNLKQELKLEQKRWKDIESVCRACSGAESHSCESHDCSVYFTKVRQEKRLAEIHEIKKETSKLLLW